MTFKVLEPIFNLIQFIYIYLSTYFLLQLFIESFFNLIGKLDNGNISIYGEYTQIKSNQDSLKSQESF